MELNLKRPLVFIDLETTGINVASDRIVEISSLKISPNGNEQWMTTLVNPGIPIPPKVTAIHGITDSDVAEAPTFKEIAKNLTSFLEGCDLAGFNAMKFDKKFSSSANKFILLKGMNRPVFYNNVEEKVIKEAILKNLSI